MIAQSENGSTRPLGIGDCVIAKITEAPFDRRNVGVDAVHQRLAGRFLTFKDTRNLIHA